MRDLPDGCTTCGLSLVACHANRDVNRASCCESCQHHEVCACGYEVGTFACKVRHIQINSGVAKAARD